MSPFAISSPCVPASKTKMQLASRTVERLNESLEWNEQYIEEGAPIQGLHLYSVEELGREVPIMEC